MDGRKDDELSLVVAVDLPQTVPPTLPRRWTHFRYVVVEAACLARLVGARYQASRRPYLDKWHEKTTHQGAEGFGTSQMLGKLFTSRE